MQKSPPIILLEHPRPQDPSRHQDVVNAPLSANLFSPYISSLLKSEAIPVEILDAHLLGWSIDRTLEELSKRSPKLLGVHTLYLWDNTQEVFGMFSKLKERGIKAHINLFGYYPTFAYQGILEQFPFIDSVTIGELEHTFLELAQWV
ncbi:MAG: hypothetical protein Q6354_01790, partial [Candidatus Brocadiales bacterium]|nr:hypothetical protein [Candidatus Brocadiales bacterium]